MGRKFAAETYPEARAGAGGPNVAAFARNFASGPLADTDVPIAGVQIPWNVIESTGVPSTDVPVTAHVTGKLLISGVVALENTSSDPVNVQVEIQINGVSLPVPADLRSLIDGAVAEGVSTMAIPFSIVVAVAPGVPVGTAFNVQVLVSADDEPTPLVQLVAASSTIEIQEITNAQ